MENPHSTDVLMYGKRLCFRDPSQLWEVLVPKFRWPDAQLWYVLLQIELLLVEFATLRRKWAYSSSKAVGKHGGAVGPRHALRKTPVWSQLGLVIPTRTAIEQRVDRWAAVA